MNNICIIEWKHENENKTSLYKQIIQDVCKRHDLVYFTLPAIHRYGYEGCGVKLFKKRYFCSCMIQDQEYNKVRLKTFINVSKHKLIQSGVIDINYKLQHV